jgi:hypothetical protein
MRIVCGIPLFMIIAGVGLAQEPKSCAGVEALIGEWTGAGTGAPGEGNGGFTFRRDLQGKVIVRKNFAEYPPTKNRPAYRHEDLMIMYEDSSKMLQADYWDNEGHVIHYAVAMSPDRCIVTFESPRTTTDAAYKLRYTFKSPDEMSIDFQIAPPGKDFGNYITASAKRKK